MKGRRPVVWLFVGPSVPGPELAAACARIDADVHVLPPIQQGDLLRTREPEADIVGIIDGFFFQVPSVSHKEILLALERGQRVLGASSLGALRAAELDAYGMEGVGEVYRLYRQGVIDGDDEVAVVHASADDGFRPLTDPLVDIRHKLHRAVRRGCISSPTAAAVLAAARRRHFSVRSYAAAVADAAGHAPAAELAALETFLAEDTGDLKRDDALALVRLVAERVAGRLPWPPAPTVHTERTVYLHLFERAYVGEGGVTDALVLSLHRVLSPSFPDLVRAVGRRCLAVDEARHRGLEPTDEGALVAGFRRVEGLESDADYRSWRCGRGLSPAELEVALVDRDLERRLWESYPQGAAQGVDLVAEVADRLGVSQVALEGPLFMRPGIPWEAPLLREMKFRGEFGPAAETARRVVWANAAVAEHLPGFAEALSAERLERWLAGRWGVGPGHLDDAILARGVADHRELLQAARLAYVHELGLDHGNGF